MNDTTPTGTEDDPFFTDAVPLSAGVALVIGVAGAAAVLASSVLRSWRRVSLAQTRGLLLARIHLLVLVLLAVTAVSLGATPLFPDDTRALGGLLPLVGVLAPFVFIARRPDAATASDARPSRTRLLDWLLQSPVNLLISLPGFACVALSVWAAVRAKAWDVLALAFSASVAVLTRADPPLYRAWDGVGPHWQWGRLLPCPVRSPSWRFVIGRVEDADGHAGVEIDAMELPTVDTLLLQGALFGETHTRSDRALARSIVARGVLASLPQFYDYADGVWAHVIHEPPRADPKGGRLLDETAASCFLLIASLLREALVEGARLGADVWLLLALFRYRLNDIAVEYISASNVRRAPWKQKMRILISDVWSTFAGRSGGVLAGVDEAINVGRDTADSVDTATFNADQSASSEQAVLTNEGSLADTGDQEAATRSNENEGSAVVEIEDVEANSDEGQMFSGSSTQRAHRPLEMWQAMDATEDPPMISKPELWVDWIMKCMQRLYKTAVEVSNSGSSEAARRQCADMPEQFADWLGEGETAALRTELLEACSGVALSGTRSGESNGAGDQEDKPTVVELASVRVSVEEVFTYLMMSLAGREITSDAYLGDDSVGFESVGVDVSQGELNGRLKAQNAAYKLMVAQNALWGYVALGQTATALLSR